MRRTFLWVVASMWITILFASPSTAQSGSADQPYKELLPDVETTIERTATVAMRRISEARADIRHHDPAAKKKLTEASLLINGIRGDLSTSPVQNLIAVARNHLKYEQPEQVLEDFPALYDSLARISTYIPTDQAKMRLDLAKKFLEQKKKADADRQLFLADESLTIVEVVRPLVKVEYYLRQAQGFISAKNTKKADQALQRAEKHTMALVSGMSSPMYKARNSLGRASAGLSAHKTDEVENGLREAMGSLDRAAAAATSKGKDEIIKLAGEISAMDRKLAADGTVTEKDLKTAWQKSEALSERAAAYVAADIANAETTVGGENSLIEAKLHVSYAEAYRMTARDEQKSQAEIEKALAYLRKAETSPLAGPSARKSIHGISLLLESLKTEKNDAYSQEVFDKAKQGLDQLVDTL